LAFTSRSAVPILRAITYLKQSYPQLWSRDHPLHDRHLLAFLSRLKWRSSKAMKKAQKLAPKMKELQRR
jgi:hypothetical protein